MPEFIVRLEAGSVIRLIKKSYDEESERRTVQLGFPYAQLAIFDRLEQVADNVRVPDGLVIFVKLPAENIDAAISQATGIADHALSMMSCVTMCAVDVPYPVWAYDATNGVQDRQYCHFFYDGLGPRGSRPLNDQHLIALLEKNYNSLMADASLKDDFKARVQRSMMAFRRGLSDNDDVLNEFLTAWSTMEGLDCVYCKVLPSATVRQFKDGIKDVLTRLGRPEVFGPLEGLRNEIAHGSLSLEQAIQTARGHLDLIRQALVLMIIRILKLDEKVCNEIVRQVAYKGKYRPHIRILATIRFEPGDIHDPTSQPQVKIWRESAKYTKNTDTLGFEPDIRIEPVNLSAMTPLENQFWGEPGLPIRMHGFQSSVIRRGDT